MKYWIAGIFVLSTLTQPLLAAERVLFQGRPALETHYSVEARGRTLRFNAYRYINEQGETEVAYDFQEMRFLLPKTSLIVLYGRDLDSDQRIDAWFIPREPGVMDSLERTAYGRDDGWEIARDILTNHMRLQERNYLDLVVHAVSASITMGGNTAKTYFEGLLQREMNLLDAEIRAGRLWKKQRMDPAAVQLFEWTREGWAEITRELTDTKLKEYVLWIFADMASWGFGGKFATWIGPKLVPPQVATWAKSLSDRFFASLSAHARQVAARIPSGTAAAATAATTRNAMGLAFKTITEKMVIAIRAMETRSTLERWAARGLLNVGHVAQSGFKHIPYISVVIGTLTASELFNRHGDHSNGADGPILYLKNAATDQDMLQSLVFMSDETFVQAAITASSKNVPGRMLITGLVSTGDSYVVGSVVQGNTDPRRLRVDAIWQATAGNIQTNLDMGALEYFEKAFLKSGNPRWKLVGWACVIVSQFGGMMLYEKAVDHWARSTETQETPSSAELKRLTESSEVRLVPIVTDM